MKLFPHQVDGLKQTEGHDNCALYWDMGLGKTFGGSEKMATYDNRVNLIICQKSKVNDWVNHMKNHYPVRIQVYDLTKPKEYRTFCGVAIGDKYRVVGVINYELAWRRDDLWMLKDFTLMLDESSLIQNRKAKQTKFILSLHPKNVILLSGTPTAGKYENLWTQAHLLGWSISEDLYNRQYVNWKTVESDGFFHKIVDMDNPYKNVERLKQKFRDHGAVFMKTEEVFDLPGQTFTTVTVPVSKEYKKFMKTGYVQMPDGTELIGDQIFTKRLHARQLCGMYNQAKLEAFKELIQSTNDRVIVFYNFTMEMGKMLDIAYELERPVSIVNGQLKDLDAYENHGDSVTFIQYQAGAMGLNLQKANKIIYFTLPERSDLFEQSKARIHRIGQDRPCFYWIMMCERSVEEVIYQTLLERKDFTDELFERM
jgi:SNF2 family DNA or RNA helicase